MTRHQLDIPTCAVRSSLKACTCSDFFRLRTMQVERVEKDFWNEQANLFRVQVKRGRVIALRDTSHFFFQDPKLTDEVIRGMRTFLLPVK